jgi:uncharacterized protein
VSGTTYLKPLYAKEETAPDEVVLHGGICSCGHSFFPMQAYGCEMCGQSGEALQPKLLRGRGRLVASAVVHIHPDKSRPVPFTIVEVALEQGPTVRTLLAEGAADPKPGAQMRATLVHVRTNDVGDEIVDLRFVSAEPAASGY